MKTNLLLIAAFISVIIYANIDELHGIVGMTRLDGSVGCVCHGIDFNDSVYVWIEGPDSVYVNDTAYYKILMTGGPAISGGFNVAARIGHLDSLDFETRIIIGQLTHSAPKSFLNDTVYWSFKYTAPDSIVTDTIYSVANSVNGDSIPSGLDQWNFGENFVVHVIDNPVPVELSNLIVVANLNNIQISWNTLTETNNSGFEIERKTESSEWFKITFVPGFGTTTETHSYTYNDNYLQGGRYFYRLKQINQNGSFVYSDMINIEVSIPEEFTLEQNYPNPFNPETNIRFRIPEFGHVSLKVYDILGNEIATLVNEEKPAGSYEVDFNASALPSGVYFYRLEANGFSQTKKMILMK